MSFDAFLKQRIFDPCGMSSTWFQVPRAEAKRLTTNYGVLGTVFAPIDEGRNSIFLEAPPVAVRRLGAGLFAARLRQFLRMLAQYGRLGKERVMGELAVRGRHRRPSARGCRAAERDDGAQERISAPAAGSASARKPGSSAGRALPARSARSTCAAASVRASTSSSCRPMPTACFPNTRKHCMRTSSP